MTWEYLIGSDKDFEGAPDWCTHVAKSLGSYFWEMGSAIKVGNKYQRSGHGDGVFVYDKTHAVGCKLEIVAQRRNRKSKQWDGVGLPHVGCECEAFIPYLDEMQRKWRRVRVVFRGDEFNSAGEFVVVDMENTAAYWADEFRPLLTKEQIEREDAINEMARIMSGHPTITHQAIADLIFDAGYRKTK